MKECLRDSIKRPIVTQMSGNDLEGTFGLHLGFARNTHTPYQGFGLQTDGQRSSPLGRELLSAQIMTWLIFFFWLFFVPPLCISWSLWEQKLDICSRKISECKLAKIEKEHVLLLSFFFVTQLDIHTFWKAQCTVPVDYVFEGQHFCSLWLILFRYFDKPQNHHKDDDKMPIAMIQTLG